MPKQVSTTEYDLLIEIIGQFSEGALLEEIGNKLVISISKRTLQRRLEKLIQENRLRRLGKGRASRYQAIPVVVVKSGLTSPAPILTGEVENYIPISSEAAGIKQLIRRPLVDRHPVGYQQEFLDSYQANKTWYLSEEDRHKLASLGTIGEKTRPAGTYANQILNRLLIDLSWNSSRLEGNTYSLLETEQLLELGETANNKDATEAQMILNHKAAIELLVDQAGDIQDSDIQDRHRFIEIAETELMSLHAGNIARYRIRPSEFMAWQQAWKP